MDENKINDIARKFADLIDEDNASRSANVPTPMARIGGAIREALAATTADRDAQAQAVRVLGRGLFNRCFLGYDREWAAAEIARIPNAIARAAVKGGEG